MNHCNAQWIPAYAGMTQYYHGERAQQPWSLTQVISPVIPAKAGIHNGAPIMKQPAVYIMTNKAKGTLYTGVTSNLKKRVWEHRENQVEGFTQRYAISRGSPVGLL